MIPITPDIMFIVGAFFVFIGIVIYCELNLRGKDKDNDQ